MRRGATTRSASGRSTSRSSCGRRASRPGPRDRPIRPRACSLRSERPQLARTRCAAPAGFRPARSGKSLIAAGGEDRPVLHTVGHSVLPLAGFIDLLRGAGIAGLADVRRFPGSRRHPHFGLDVLESALPEAGIDYRWFEALGGRRSGPAGAESANRGLRVAAFRAYADYALTADFQGALASLLDWSAGRPTAISCAEGLWWQCHRRLIADHLVARGHAVHHILPNGGVVRHELWDLARLTPAGPVYPPEQADLLPDGNRGAAGGPVQSETGAPLS